MAEILKIDEIYARFPKEWVLMEDPVVGKDQQILRAKVLFHSRNRDEVYHKAIELRPKHSAFLYTGAIPEGTEAALARA